MSKLGDITSRLILGPAELVGEFDDPGTAAAAKANLDVFLTWCLTAPAETKQAPPAVALIIKQARLDPSDDRARKADWGEVPATRLEGACVVIDAPRSKHTRDVIRKVYSNSKPKRVFDRPKAGAPRSLAPLALVLAALGVIAFFAYFRFLR